MWRKTFCLLWFVAFSGSGGCWAQPTERFQLENGLDVVLLPLGTAKKNAIVVLYDIGNRHDPAGQSGLSHLAEHLYVTAATDQTPARTVNEYMAHYPDGWNAQTGDDYTVFATLFNPDRMDDELADAADRMRDIAVTNDDLQRELPRIESELENMYERIPMLAVQNHGRHEARRLAHDGRRGGLIEQLREVEVEAIDQHLNQYYKPKNAVLVLAGVFDAEQARQQIEELFGEIESGEEPEAAGTNPSRPADPVEIEVRPFQAGEQVRVGYTFAVPDPDSDLYPAFVVYAARLMMAGQQSVGGTRAGQTQIPPFVWRPLDDPGFFYATIAAEEGESDEQALARLDKMLQQELSVELKPTHLAQTKNVLGMFLGIQELPPAMLAFNPYGAAFAAGRRHQLSMDSAQLRKALDSLDNPQMQKAAEKIFGASNRVTVVATPAN